MGWEVHPDGLLEVRRERRRWPTCRPTVGARLFALPGRGLRRPALCRCLVRWAALHSLRRNAQNYGMTAGPQRPPDVISGQSATRCSATRIAFATIVRVGFTLPLVGCKEESQTTTRLLPQSRP